MTFFLCHFCLWLFPGLFFLRLFSDCISFHWYACISLLFQQFPSFRMYSPCIQCFFTLKIVSTSVCLCGQLFSLSKWRKKGKRKVQGVPQSQAAALPRWNRQNQTSANQTSSVTKKSNKISSPSPSEVSPSPSEVTAMLKVLNNTRTK